MSGQYGISQIKKLLALPLEVGNVLDVILNEKDMSTGKKLSYIFQLYDEAAALFTLDITQLRKEVTELDQTDKDDLKTFMRDKFNIKDDVLEAKIEESMDILDKIASLVQLIILFIKGIKP